MQSQRVFCELQTNFKHCPSEFVDSKYDFSLSGIFAKQLEWSYCFVMPEAVAHRCSVKKVLNFSQKWQENSCTNLFFNRVACLTDSQPATSLKKRLWRRCFRVNFAKKCSRAPPEVTLPSLSHSLILILAFCLLRFLHSHFFFEVRRCCAIKWYTWYSVLC